MCQYCGCDDGAEIQATNLQTGKLVVLHHHHHEHTHADGATHRHDHGHHHHTDHVHQHHGHGEPGATKIVDVGARILAKNDTLAAGNRAWLAKRQLLALNLMSGPGAGKTTLLERTIRDLKPEHDIYVLEGDQATSNDGERVRDAGASVVQINTGTGCHLDAHMVAHGLAELDPRRGSLVLIENVGNLVCPALFDLGERRRIALLSITEGEDKPLKYPHMFRAADLVLVNKIDLLPYVDFDVEKTVRYVKDVNPDADILRVSARSGHGLDAWYAWLRTEIRAVRAASVA
jgi:hydrogenase nickel incorporation protein HypB